MTEYKDQILFFIEESNEVEITRCKCGAWILTDDLSNSEIAFSDETKQQDANWLRPTNEVIYHACNYCVNDWGIDKEH